MTQIKQIDKFIERRDFTYTDKGKNSKNIFNGIEFHYANKGPVYLSGAMDHCTYEESHGWRKYATDKLSIPVLDPCRRFGRDITNPKVMMDIVEEDKADIDASSWVLCNFIKPSVGTAQEILYAFERQIPVVTVIDPKNFPEDFKPSPWLIYHSDAVYDNLDEAIESINSFAYLTKMFH